MYLSSFMETEIYEVVAKRTLVLAYEEGGGFQGNQVQANYPLGCFASNYTLVVHLHCYSLAGVLIAQ